MNPTRQGMMRGGKRKTNMDVSAGSEFMASVGSEVRLFPSSSLCIVGVSVGGRQQRREREGKDKQGHEVLEEGDAGRDAGDLAVVPRAADKETGRVRVAQQ